MFSVGLDFVCLTRNNGFLVALCTGLVLVLPLWRAWRRVLVATLVPVLLFVGLDFGVYPALGLVKPANYAGNTFLYADIAYAYSTSPAPSAGPTRH